MAERRADPCRHRKHRGDAGDDRDVERAPGRGTSLDLLANRRRHGEHAGISSRDHGDRGRRRPPPRVRLARASIPHDCPTDVGPGRSGSAPDRDRGRSRRRRRHRRAPGWLPRVIMRGSPGPSPTMARRPFMVGAANRARAPRRNTGRCRRAFRRAPSPPRLSSFRARHRSRRRDGSQRPALAGASAGFARA